MTKLMTLLLGAILGLPAPLSLAQQSEGSSGAVTVLVPFPPGTITDIVARLYAKQLGEAAGRSYVVVNRPGAGGAIASQALLAAPANGTTMMFVSSAHAITPALNTKLTFDTTRDMTGVALLGSTPTLVVVNPALGVKSQNDLLALAMKRELSYGSAGIGSAAHFACEHFAAQANAKFLHVPYKGSNEYVAEVMAGRVDIACPPIAAAAPQVRSNKLVAVSIAGDERSDMLPDVPTIREAGLPGAKFGIWYGIVVSSKTPPDVVRALARQAESASNHPEIVDALAKAGISGKVLLGADFDRFINGEIQKYRDLVRRGGIEVQ